MQISSLVIQNILFKLPLCSLCYLNCSSLDLIFILQIQLVIIKSHLRTCVHIQQTFNSLPLVCFVFMTTHSCTQVECFPPVSKLFRFIFNYINSSYSIAQHCYKHQKCHRVTAKRSKCLNASITLICISTAIMFSCYAVF